MDLQGHDEPSWTPSSHTYAISSAALFITLEGKYDGPSQAQRSVEGLRFKTLQLLECGYWDNFSELHDEPAGRTVIDTMDRHKLRNPTLGQTSHLPSAAALRCHLRTITSTTDRHKLHRWSLLHFFAQNLCIQLWTDFLQNKEKPISKLAQKGFQTH